MSDHFLAERLPRLGPRQMAELRKYPGEYTPRLGKRATLAERLERRLANPVNQAYGLTEAEVELDGSHRPAADARGPVGRVPRRAENSRGGIRRTGRVGRCRLSA